MTKFEVGKNYSTRSLCDHDCIFRFEVVGRTEKTVRIKYHGEIKSRKVHQRGDSEVIYPLGSYSMAPTLDAARDAA